MAVNAIDKTAVFIIYIHTWPKLWTHLTKMLFFKVAHVITV